MKEEWRDIKGYEGIYRVSDQGKIKKAGSRDFPCKKFPKGKYIRATLLHVGVTAEECFVGLYKDSKRKTFRISRLVAFAFVDNPHNYKYVRHLDGRKKNNWAFNLEWHKTANEPIKTKSETKKKRKLTEEERSQLPGFNWSEPRYSGS